MIIANFEGNESVKYVSGLYQYDKEQVLQITGLNLPRVVEIDFSLEETGVTSKSCPAITKDGITEVMIPNEMLVNQDTDMNYNIYAFVYVTDASASETVKRIVMQVRARTKPEQFEALGNRELFEKAINEVNDSANRAETAANTSEQNAKKTAEDRKAIAEMVETVSGIEQQVQDVKKYAGQAETAASNAALSERESKKSENVALQAKADAETAKSSAETAAGQTAEDRTAVERAKEEVLQAKQQVSTDRAAVEAVERKVAQMGNAIPQAVLEGVQEIGSAGAAEKQGIVQAGTEQRSTVESAGTKAVADINLAKKTATDAVETAKTGAVGAVGTAGTEQTKNVTTEGEKQVKAVQDKGAEVLQSIPEDFTVQMQSKLDKKQGIENAGKAMVINPEGVIVPGEVTGGDGIPIINTASGESPLVIPDSAERVNKGFGLGGNTVQNQDPPPSPDNPQEIKNVGKWNPETQKYEVDIRITNAKESWDKEQTITLTSDRPITKWDKLVERDGQIGWLYKSEIIGKFDGKSNRISLGAKKGNVQHFSVEFKNTPKGNGSADIYVDKYRAVQSSYALEEFGICCNWNDGIKYFSAPNINITNTEEFKAWLSENPLTVEYETETPEFVPFPQSEQDAIRALMTYYPTTVITVNGGEVIPTVELTYTADTKNFILNREKAMQAQMLNIQSALISQKISGGGIKVTDSSRLPVEEFVMSGKLEQMQTTGAQLFDLSGVTKGLVNRETGEIGASETYVTSDYINVDPQNKYSISNFAAYHLCYYGHDKTFETTGSGSSVFTVPENAKYIRFSVTKEKIKEVILCKGERLLPYEFYTGGKPSPRPDHPQPIETTPQGVITVDFTDGTNHQTIELNCPREFTKWDRLEKIDGVWNWAFKAIKDTDVKQSRFDLFGWNHATLYKDFENGAYAYAWSFKNKEKGWQTSICKQFKNENGSYEKGILWHYSDSPAMNRQYFITNHKTVEEFEAWVEANPLTMYFEGKETEYVPLLQEEQDKLNALTMYTPNTDVTNTGGCNMELTYTVDTKSYVDSKIAPVVKTILETQKALL